MKFHDATIEQQDAWRSMFCTKHACSHADVCRSESDEIVVACFEEHQIEYPEEFAESLDDLVSKIEKHLAEVLENTWTNLNGSQDV